MELQCWTLPVWLFPLWSLFESADNHTSDILSRTSPQSRYHAVSSKQAACDGIHPSAVVGPRAFVNKTGAIYMRYVMDFTDVFESNE